MPANAQADLKKLNQQPLNREAKNWLDMADVPATDDQQYLLQLMWWGLTDADLYPDNPDAHQLKERLTELVLNLISQQDQQAVLRLMAVGVSHDDQDENLSLDTLRNARDPKDAAMRALDALETAASALPMLSHDYPNE